jgi:hypothetical protein
MGPAQNAFKQAHVGQHKLVMLDIAQSSEFDLR